jgi:pullulanase
VQTLHPELVASADPLLRTATATAGTFTVPARSVAVFVTELG